MARRERNPESPAFLGLRIDVPLEGGFSKCKNVEFVGPLLKQRNPRQDCDNSNPTSGEYYKVIHYLPRTGNDIVICDVPDGLGEMNIVAAYNTPDGTDVSIGSYYEVEVGLDIATGSYQNGDIGAYRVDGENDNMIIWDITTTYPIGVTPPANDPTIVAGSQTFIPPPIRPTDFTVEAVQAPGEGGYLVAGQYSLFITYVKTVGSDQYESAPSDIKTVTVPDGTEGMITVTFSASGESDVTLVRCYRTKVIGTEGETEEFSLDDTPTFYQEGEVADTAGSYDFVYVDSVLGTEGFPEYSGVFGEDPAASFSLYNIYYCYVKKYADGRETISSPSPALTVTAEVDPVFQVGYTASAEYGVNYIRFYRNLFKEIGDDIFYQCKEIANAGSSTTLDATDTYIDVFDVPLEFDNDKVGNCKYVILDQGVMVYLNFPGVTGGGSMFQFSKEFEYEHVPNVNLVNFDPEDGNPITGVFSLYGELYVGKSNKIAKYSRSNLDGAITYRRVRDISATMGIFDNRCTKNVDKDAVIFLSLEGFIYYDGQKFANISKNKIQTIVKQYIDAEAEFSAVYYPESNQYHVIIFTLAAGKVDDHRYFVCHLDNFEWTEMEFRNDNGEIVFDVCLGKAIDEKSREVIISAYDTGTNMQMQQYDIPPGASILETTEDEITEIGSQSAWSSCFYSNDYIFFLGKNGTGDDSLFYIPESGGSYGVAVEVGAPSFSDTLLRVAHGDDYIFILGLDPINDDQMVLARYVSSFTQLDLDLDDSGIYVPQDEFNFIPLSSGNIFYSYLAPDTDYGMYDKDTEQAGGYDVGDIVYEKQYRRVKEYWGATEYSYGAGPTNGNYFHWAYPWPEVLEYPVGENTIYLYDQTDTLSDGVQIHFSGIHDALYTTLEEGIDYYVNEVEDQIYTVSLELAGTPLAIAGPYYSHEGTQGSFVYHHLEVAPIMRWLPAATEFTFSTEVEYTVHDWEYLDIRSYVAPYFSITGDDPGKIYEFEYGDRVYGNSFFKSGNYIYFSWYRAADEKFWISRIKILFGEGEEIAYTVENIKQIKVSDMETGDVRLFINADQDRIFCYNGVSFKEYSYARGWDIAQQSDPITLTWVDYCPALQSFWAYGTVDEEVVVMMIDQEFNLYPMNIELPESLVGFAAHPTLYRLSACHNSEGIPLPPQHETVYLIEKLKNVINILISTIIRDFEANYQIFGVVVELVSCLSDRYINHFRQGVYKGYFQVNSFNPSLGIFSIRPDRNRRSKEERVSSDYIYCEGTPTFASEDVMEMGRLHEVEVGLEADSTSYRWELEAGDMIDGYHATLYVYPPGFKIKVMGEAEDGD